MCIDTEMLSSYKDGELKEPYRTQVEAHLEHCAACRKLLDNLTLLDDTVKSDSYSNEALEKNKDAIFDKLDNKFFKSKSKFGFLRKRIQMSVPQLITAAAAAAFIFVGGFMLFGNNSSQTEDILPSFAVNAENGNVKLVSSESYSLDNYSLDEILKYLDSKGYKVDITLKGIEPLDIE